MDIEREERLSALCGSLGRELSNMERDSLAKEVGNLPLDYIYDVVMTSLHQHNVISQGLTKNYGT